MLTLDPANPVIVAIGRGMRAEMAQEMETARAAYAEAWDAATDDFERCMAAHYVPRLVEDPHEKLRWNEEALRLAIAVGDERVRGFFASLHGCVGQCRVSLGDVAGGRAAFEAARACLVDVPEGAYKDGVAAIIAEGCRVAS